MEVQPSMGLHFLSTNFCEISSWNSKPRRIELYLLVYVSAMVEVLTVELKGLQTLTDQISIEP
jgi:hypothetical protein